MKKIIILLICTFFSSEIHAQDIIGAWESTSTSEKGDELKSVVIFADGYQVISTYNAVRGKFIHTNGGTWN